MENDNCCDESGSLPAEAVVLQTLLQDRFSCRAYKPDAVPEDILCRILELAQRTASWCNSQPWEVIVTSGMATERFRAALLANARETPPSPDYSWPSKYEGVYQERRRECALAYYDACGIERGDKQASAKQSEENYRFFGAPHAVIITSEAQLGTYGAVDCGAYIANFMLAAKSFGVSSIAQAAIASRSVFVRQHFGLPEHRRVICGISLGYADTGHPANSFRTSRAPLKQTATFLY